MDDGDDNKRNESISFYLLSYTRYTSFIEGLNLSFRSVERCREVQCRGYRGIGV